MARHGWMGHLKGVFGNGLFLFIVATTLFSGCVTSYALTQIDRPQRHTNTQQKGHAQQGADKGVTKDTAELSAAGDEQHGHDETGDVGSSGRPKRGASSTQGSTPQDNRGTESSAGRITVSASTLSLGGAAGDVYASSDVRHTSGKLLEYSLFFSKTPSFTGERTLSFSGLNIQESDLTNGTEPMTVRTVVVHQSDLLASGRATFYVFASMAMAPVPITVTWQPAPHYGVVKTGQTRTDTGSAIEHTFSFRIDPSQNFGTPQLEVTSYGGILDDCGAGSVVTIQTMYSGVRDFTLRCVVPKMVCQGACPLISGTRLTVGVSARSSSGKYILGFGAEGLVYDIPVPSAYF